MAKDIESEIRMALDEKAHEVDVPADLAERTLAEAREAARERLGQRLRARLDAWRYRAGVSGYPRWAYAGSAVAMAALLFVVGSIVRTDPAPLDQPVAAPAIEGPTVVEDSAGEEGSAPGAEPARRDEDLAKGAPDVATGGGGTTSQIAPVPPVPSRPGQFPPKIVRTANLEVQVPSFDRAWSRANGLATRHGGFVTNSEAGLERGTVVMRIPANKLEAALADLRELGKVVTTSTTAEDVSAQIVDIDARVRTLEAEELQLVELLRRASGVSQTLEVRDRLNAVRQEIESYKAQKEFYANQVEYSTINATLFESGADDPDDPGDGILLDAWRTALRAGLTIVAGALVVLGGLVPLAAIGLAAWFAIRAYRRRRA
jgi:hypothetical protein